MNSSPVSFSKHVNTDIFFHKPHKDSKGKVVPLLLGGTVASDRFILIIITGVIKANNSTINKNIEAYLEETVCQPLMDLCGFQHLESH